MIPQPSHNRLRSIVFPGTSGGVRLAERASISELSLLVSMTLCFSLPGFLAACRPVGRSPVENERSRWAGMLHEYHLLTIIESISCVEFPAVPGAFFHFHSLCFYATGPGWTL